MTELTFYLVFFSPLVTGNSKLQRSTKFEEYSAPKLATLPMLRRRKKVQGFQPRTYAKKCFSSNTAKEYYTLCSTCKISLEERYSFYKLSCLDSTRLNNFDSEHIPSAKRFRATIGGFLTPELSKLNF